jgi:hypothetical protein
MLIIMLPGLPVSWPTEAWSKVGIDIVGEMSDVPESKRFVITLIDHHSRWPDINFCRNVTSRVVISFLIDMFIRHGIPDTVVTDNGNKFVYVEFERSYG